MQIHRSSCSSHISSGVVVSTGNACQVKSAIVNRIRLCKSILAGRQDEDLAVGTGGVAIIVKNKVARRPTEGEIAPVIRLRIFNNGHAAGFAEIAYPVVIGIFLIRILDSGAVITRIAHAVVIGIGLVGVLGSIAVVYIVTNAVTVGIRTLVVAKEDGRLRWNITNGANNIACIREVASFDQRGNCSSRIVTIQREGKLTGSEVACRIPLDADKSGASVGAKFRPGRRRVDDMIQTAFNP